MLLREYIPNEFHIDGRNIPYSIFTLRGYLYEKNINNIAECEDMDEFEKKAEQFEEDNPELCQTITQILALKHSWYILRRVRYSCGTLSDSLLPLKRELIQKTTQLGHTFDEDLVNECIVSRRLNR